MNVDLENRISRSSVVNVEIIDVEVVNVVNFIHSVVSDHLIS